MTTTEYAAFERKANALGWHLDISPETELARVTYWRHGSTFALKEENDLIDYIDAMEQTEPVALSPQDVDTWAKHHEAAMVEETTEGRTFRNRPNPHE